MPKSICFVGLQNLPVLAQEFNRHGIGGEEVQHTLLAKALAARGYRVSMITADYGQADGAEWDGIKVYKAYKPEAGWPGLRFFIPRWTGMWSALKRADADVYYISCAGFRVGLCALFGRIYRRRILFRIASDTDCEPSKLLIEHNLWREKRLYEFGLRRVDAILAQSEKQQEALRRNYGLNCRLAAMMVDQAQMNLTFEQRSVSVLWVSNLRDLKRPDLLLELAARIPNLDVHMIGGAIASSVALYDEIRQRAETMQNVTFHGQIPYHDVNEFFARARVFVNTSDIEGFPNSYLQAWARGTPVIAFFDPDHLIAREGLGFAVQSMEEMQIAVAELTANAALWRTTSDRCKAFMAREFNQEKILAPYVEVIEKSGQYERYGGEK
jgi:glycosyltransferase involved in cell wall biosynthesis